MVNAFHRFVRGIMPPMLMLVGVTGCDSILCGNKILREINSSDRMRKAVVFERDCGATDGGSTQVSILDVDDKLPSSKGNAFIVKYYPDVKVHWQSDRRLVIQYPKSYRVFAHEVTVKDVSIRYETNKQE